MSTTLRKQRRTTDTPVIARSLKVLADENRLRIMGCLAGGRRCVCELTDALDVPQNLISHHLRVLKESGFVISSREGRWIYYSLNTSKLNVLLTTLRDYPCFCDGPSSCR